MNFAYYTCSSKLLSSLSCQRILRALHLYLQSFDLRAGAAKVYFACYTGTIKNATFEPRKRNHCSTMKSKTITPKRVEQFCTPFYTEQVILSVQSFIIIIIIIVKTCLWSVFRKRPTAKTRTRKTTQTPPPPQEQTAKTRLCHLS